MTCVSPREVPGELKMPLIMTGEPVLHNMTNLLRVVHSDEVCNSDLAQVLNGRNFSDGRIMLQAIQMA